MPTRERSARDGGAMRVLVVDDNADMREVLGLILKIAGHAVEAVGDGEWALARLREAQFDLILLDLIMPGLGGLDFLDAYRARCPGPRVPVVLSSASPERLARLAGTEGVDAVLPRPFEIGQLLALVEGCARPSPAEPAHARR